MNPEKEKKKPCHSPPPPTPYDRLLCIIQLRERLREIRNVISPKRSELWRLQEISERLKFAELGIRAHSQDPREMDQIIEDVRNYLNECDAKLLLILHDIKNELPFLKESLTYLLSYNFTDLYLDQLLFEYQILSDVLKEQGCRTPIHFNVDYKLMQVCDLKTRFRCIGHIIQRRLTRF